MIQHKRISHFLIAAGAMAGIGVLALALIYAPVLAKDVSESLCAEDPSLSAAVSGLKWAGLAGVWAAALVFLLALAEFFRVSARIGRDQSFCPENVKSLRRIAFFLSLNGVLWIAAVFVPGLFGFPVGPAWLLFLLASMAHFALAMLAWCLGRLLARAVEMQQENDLTV